MPDIIYERCCKCRSAFINATTRGSTERADTALPTAIYFLVCKLCHPVQRQNFTGITRRHAGITIYTEYWDGTQHQMPLAIIKYFLKNNKCLCHGLERHFSHGKVQCLVDSSFLHILDGYKQISKSPNIIWSKVKSIIKKWKEYGAHMQICLEQVVVKN